MHALCFFDVAESSYARTNPQHLHSVGSCAGIAFVDASANAENGRVNSTQVVNERFPNEPVLAVQCDVNSSQSGQSRIPQASLHRIAHHQCADERRATHRRAEHHAQMRAPVEEQAAPNKRPESHRVTSFPSASSSTRPMRFARSSACVTTMSATPSSRFNSTSNCPSAVADE